jgi:hypothetical protein
MHCKSLGIDKPLLGGTLYVLVHYILLGSVEENLAEVWRDIEHYYNELGTENRYGQTMFHTKSQPKLQGKAAEVRDLGPVMVKVWEKHMNQNLQIHQKILVVLKSSFFLVFEVLSYWVVVVGFTLSRISCDRMSLGILSPSAPLHPTCL